jgi:hypothetical protein
MTGMPDEIFFSAFIRVIQNFFVLFIVLVLTGFFCEMKSVLFNIHFFVQNETQF